MSEKPLFVVDYSTDELGLLADLLEVEALPLGPPGSSLSDDVRAAVSRGLVARGVLNILGPDEVEITQPHASIFGVVKAAESTTELAVVSKERLTRSATMLGSEHHVTAELLLSGVVRFALLGASGRHPEIGPSFGGRPESTSRLPMPAALQALLRSPASLTTHVDEGVEKAAGGSPVEIGISVTSRGGETVSDCWMVVDGGAWLANGVAGSEDVELAFHPGWRPQMLTSGGSASEVISAEAGR